MVNSKKITKDKTLKTLTSKKSDEHNTPSFLIEAAREIMENIDLDPMSNPLANQIIKAETFYTKHNNGLDKEWFGRVWLNPPFSLADKAVRKLIDSYEEGNVTQAVLLLKSASDTKRYQWLYPYPFCNLNKRVRYYTTDESNKFVAPFSTTLFYFGNEYWKWKKIMSEIGTVHPGNRLFNKLAMNADREDLYRLGILMYDRFY